MNFEETAQPAPHVLDEVDRWPTWKRRRWAERTLEIRDQTGVSLEEAELRALADVRGAVAVAPSSGSKRPATGGARTR